MVKICLVLSLVLLWTVWGQFIFGWSSFVVFTQCSNVLLMNLGGGESGFPVLFLLHLRTAPKHVTYFKRPWCWERLKGGGGGDDRGINGWMPSLTQWTWVSSRNGDGQEGLECCRPWGHKELDMTEWLDWTDTYSYTYSWASQWLAGKESSSQCRKWGFDPLVRKISQKRKWQPTPVFLPGESHEQRSL